MKILLKFLGLIGLIALAGILLSLTNTFNESQKEKVEDKIISFEPDLEGEVDTSHIAISIFEMAYLTGKEEDVEVPEITRDSEIFDILSTDNGYMEIYGLVQKTYDFTHEDMVKFWLEVPRDGTVGAFIDYLNWYLYIQNRSQIEEEISLMSLNDVEIFLEDLKADDEIESPLVIKGKAPGFWFFEGDASILLTNWDGLIIAESYITAKGDWMAGDYVEFEGVLEFDKPLFGERGYLILQRDNPSDLIENDDAAEIVIYFN